MDVIVNADDFGISSGVNRAIVEAFKRGLISSTTIMTNAEGFEEAVDLIFSENLHGQVGVHLNLTHGKPLTERMAGNKLFCDHDGNFKSKRQTLFYLQKEERESLRCELQAQIDRIRDFNIEPTHLDSHHHYHTEWAIGREVIGLAKRNGIKGIRLSRNCGSISKPKLLYKKIYNYRLKRSTTFHTNYFGSVSDIMSILGSLDSAKRIELMVHPGFDQHGDLVDLGAGDYLESLMHLVKKELKVEHFVSY